jgi:DNA-binding XRE family transcriptional regulator
MLKLYRTVQDMDQRTMAKEIGISASTLCRMEGGKNIDLSSMSKVLIWMFG